MALHIRRIPIAPCQVLSLHTFFSCGSAAPAAHEGDPLVAGGLSVAAAEITLLAWALPIGQQIPALQACLRTLVTALSDRSQSFRHA